MFDRNNSRIAKLNEARRKVGFWDLQIFIKVRQFQINKS